MSGYTFLANRLVFPLGDRIFGTRIIRFLKELEENQWWSPEEIRADQEKNLCGLVKHSYENVPYWKNLFDGLNLKPSDIKTKQDLEKLPILTKDDIRKNLHNMVAKNFPQKKLRENHSSGSTGEPLKYFDDKEHYSWRIASMFRFWRWAGFEFGKKWARISLWPHNKLVNKIQDCLVKCLYICISEIDDVSLTENVQRTIRYKPEVIRGYACATYLLAKRARDMGVNNIRPKAVITTGDMLFPNYRKLIEEQFDCKVFDTYGGEGMVISGQCERGNYHTDDNDLIVEYIADDGSRAKAGELANIIVTDLRNFAMPFLRYKIQDLGKYSDKTCACGRGLSVMESIEGRDSDIIRVPDGSYLIVHFFTGLFEYQEGVEQFQIIQRKLDEIEIKIVRNDKLTDADIEYIGRSIQEGGGENLKVNFNFVDDIPVEKSGKRRFVISQIE